MSNIENNRLSEIDRVVDSIEDAKRDLFDNIEDYDKLNLMNDAKDLIEDMLEQIDELEYVNSLQDDKIFDILDWSNWLKEDLVNEAESYGLNCKGTKLDIIQRLVKKLH